MTRSWRGSFTTSQSASLPRNRSRTLVKRPLIRARRRVGSAKRGGTFAGRNEGWLVPGQIRLWPRTWMFRWSSQSTGALGLARVGLVLGPLQVVLENDRVEPLGDDTPVTVAVRVRSPAVDWRRRPIRRRRSGGGV